MNVAYWITAPETGRFELAEVPTPKPASNEICVRLHAAALNPVDYKVRRRLQASQAAPTVLGCDGAGVVESIGNAVTRFAVGQAVYFTNGGFGRAAGTYASHAVIDERFAAHKPASLDFEQAAAVPLALITAWESLHDLAGIVAGDCVLIHAGAGGVGHFAVQLAVNAGAHVATTVSAHKAALASQLGAEKIIDYQHADFAEEILAWTDGAGADIIFDTVGGATFLASPPAVRYRGDLVTCVETELPPQFTELPHHRNLRISFEWMPAPQIFDLPAARIAQRQILEQAATLFDADELTVHVSKTFPLAELSQAHSELEKNSTAGKIVIAIP